MKQFIAMVSLVILSGCAHATIHEICSDPDVVSRYKDYDQCYAEESAAREQRKAAWKSAWAPKPKIECTTTNNGGMFSHTTCQ